MPDLGDICKKSQKFEWILCGGVIQIHSPSQYSSVQQASPRLLSLLLQIPSAQSQWQLSAPSVLCCHKTDQTGKAKALI